MYCFSRVLSLQCVAVLLALVYGASSFVVPAPCSFRSAALAGSTTGLPAVEHARMRSSWRFDGPPRVGMPQQQQQQIATRRTSLAAARGGREGKQEEEEEQAEKSGGIEPKYLAAIGVVVFAALYDLFVTHEGRLWEL